MDFRVSKIPNSLDHLSGVANSLVMQATATKVKLFTSRNGISANGDGSPSTVRLGLIATPGRWKVVGIGGYINLAGAEETAESMTWGYKISDIGAGDPDAFGSVVCVTTANKHWIAGDVIYQGVSPFDNFFGFDAEAQAGAHVWDISGTGAGVKMDVWQSKAALLSATKANVASSTATIVPFMLIEYESGAGVI